MTHFNMPRDHALYISALAPAKTEVAVDENKAKEFLSNLKRQKRQLWDRTRPDVQQWYQQFLYMGYDEAVRMLGCPPYRLVGTEAWLGHVSTRKQGFAVHLLHASAPQSGIP